MPQLDRLIIFPQIFWFFLIFSCFYYILTYVFLPRFLISLKIRRTILLENTKNSNLIFSKYSSNNILLKNHLINNLNFIKTQLYVNNKFDLNKLDIKSTKLDEKFVNSTFKVLLYCNINLLNSILFYPKNFNLNFKKIL